MPDQEAPHGAWQAASPQIAPAPQQPAPAPPQANWLPSSPKQEPSGPTVHIGGERNAEAGKNWNTNNLPMTAEVHQQTKPYFDVVQNLGRDYKNGHQTSFDAKEFVKKNPDASLDEITARYQKVNDNKVHLPMASEMAKAYSNIETPEAFAPLKASFERDYAAMRNLMNRPMSELEKVLPENSPLRTKLDPATGAFRDPKTGLYADLKTVGEGPNAKQVMVFGGTGVGGMTKQQIIADGLQIAGKIPSNYRQALDLATTVHDSLKQANPSVAFETAGHSLGGGLANYAGLKLQVPMTCFNAAALGSGCRDDIGAEKLSRAKQLATHVNLKGEAISDGAHLGPLNLRKGVDLVTPNRVAPHQYGQSYQMDNVSGSPLTLHKTNAIEKAFNKFADTHGLGQKQDAPAVAHEGPALQAPAVNAAAAQLGGHRAQGQGPAQTPQWQAAMPSQANPNMDAAGLAVEGAGLAGDLGGQAMNGPQGPKVGAPPAANLAAQVPEIAADQVANLAAQEDGLSASQVQELNEDSIGIVENKVEELAADELVDNTPQVEQAQDQEQPAIEPNAQGQDLGQEQGGPAKKSVREVLLGSARAKYQPNQAQAQGQGMGAG